jgi:ferrous iron transport protein A
MTLDNMPKKTNARVVALDSLGIGRLRLMEMGIVPGAVVRVVNSAPFGDPLHIFVKNYHLALRREDARSVHVTLCDKRVASSMPQPLIPE